MQLQTLGRVIFHIWQIASHTARRRTALAHKFSQPRKSSRKSCPFRSGSSSIPILVGLLHFHHSVSCWRVGTVQTAQTYVIKNAFSRGDFGTFILVRLVAFRAADTHSAVVGAVYATFLLCTASAADRKNNDTGVIRLSFATSEIPRNGNEVWTMNCNAHLLGTMPCPCGLKTYH